MWMPVFRKILRVTPLVCLWLPLAEAGAACEPRVERMEVPAVEREPANAPSTLKVVATDPAADAPMNKDTVLTVDLEYRIANFSGTYTLAPTFKVSPTKSGLFMPGGQDPRVRIDSAAGRVRTCIPLSGFYAEDSDRVFWPLEFIYGLYGKDDARHPTVAWTAAVRLNAAEAPANALALQSKAATPEIEDAIEVSFLHFQGRRARYKACLQRFPALQPRLTPAYRSWESRHKADIDSVSELRFEQIKRQGLGRVDAATWELDRIDALALEQEIAMAAAALRPLCESLFEELGVADDRTEIVIGDYLSTLRKWRAGKNP